MSKFKRLTSLFSSSSSSTYHADPKHRGAFRARNISSTANEAEFNIVALSGLNSHAYGSWVGPEIGGVMPIWLQDFFGQDEDLKYCRTMTFGYNTKYKIKAKLWIEDYVKSFLTELVKTRRTEAEWRRPLVLMGHSFGGTIITHAFVKASIEESYADIYNSITAIFFFGVPFRGIHLDDVLTIVDDDDELANQSHELVRDIVYETRRITQIFEIFMKKIQERETSVYSFYETQKTRKVVKKNGKYGRHGDYVIVVEKNSARLGIPKFEEVLQADGNHSTIVKLKSTQDPTYTSVRERLKKVIVAAETPLAQTVVQSIAASKQTLEALQISKGAYAF
ncbi:hypothetical protein TWF173_010165 [Orbilia oligospora]|nr:hypothetical protein TWF173_010165 [Orbilia oligospora]